MRGATRHRDGAADRQASRSIVIDLVGDDSHPSTRFFSSLLGALVARTSSESYASGRVPRVSSQRPVERVWKARAWRRARPASKKMRFQVPSRCGWCSTARLRVSIVGAVAGAPRTFSARQRSSSRTSRSAATAGVAPRVAAGRAGMRPYRGVVIPTTRSQVASCRPASLGLSMENWHPRCTHPLATRTAGGRA